MASLLRPHPVPAQPRAATPRHAGAAPSPLARARCAGGPQDRALYRCECGTAFRAAVSASVACPSCGGEQSW